MSDSFFEKSQASIGLTDQQRLDWLRLIRSENVGPATFYTLLNHYGSAKKALEAVPDLAKRGGLSKGIKIATSHEAEREMEGMKRIKASFIALGESNYPCLLREINAPPPLISVRGNLRAFSLPSVAIVGSRNASALGIKMATVFARDLAEEGFAVVSGLARGVDAAAHHASLKLGTIGVLAGGLDKPYPPENVPLMEQMLAMGAVISEMPLAWEPRARDFPRRNRLISGIAMATLVVEAAERSGTLITARLANEEGREVFAIPGSPLDPRSAGTNRLIKQGATMVTSSDELIDALRPILGRKIQPIVREQFSLFDDEHNEPHPQERDHILGLLNHSAVDLDDLARAAGLSASLTRVILLELSLAGKVDFTGGGVSLRVDV
jgi:DNA processing protein